MPLKKTVSYFQCSVKPVVTEMFCVFQHPFRFGQLELEGVDSFSCTTDKGRPFVAVADALIVAVTDDEFAVAGDRLVVCRVASVLDTFPAFGRLAVSESVGELTHRCHLLRLPCPNGWRARSCWRQLLSAPRASGTSGSRFPASRYGTGG